MGELGSERMLSVSSSFVTLFRVSRPHNFTLVRGLFSTDRGNIVNEGGNSG